MGCLGGSMVERLPLAQGVILGSGIESFISILAGSLLLPLPMSLPLSVCLSWINKIFKRKDKSFRNISRIMLWKLDSRLEVLQMKRPLQLSSWVMGECLDREKEGTPKTERDINKTWQSLEEVRERVNWFKNNLWGTPGWLSGWESAFGSGCNPRVPHRTPCQEPTPSTDVSALSLSLSWINK